MKDKYYIPQSILVDIVTLGLERTQELSRLLRGQLDDLHAPENPENLGIDLRGPFHGGRLSRHHGHVF